MKTKPATLFTRFLALFLALTLLLPAQAAALRQIQEAENAGAEEVLAQVTLPQSCTTSSRRFGQSPSV